MRKFLVLICLILAAQASAGLKGSFIPEATDQTASVELSEPTQFDTTVYFVHAFPSFIERFNLSTETWLNELDLSDIPTAFHADADGMYVGFGRRVSFLEANGTERHLANTSNDITDIISNDNWLFVLNARNLLIINKFTGSRISDTELWYSAGLSIAPDRNRIYGRTSGLSPSDILYYDYDPVTGALGGAVDSPYHGDYPYATQTYIEPGGTRVFDDSGIGYFMDDLTYAGSLGDAFQDILFYQGNIIVRRGRTLTAYSPYLRDTGIYELANDSAGMALNGDVIFSFSSGESGWIVEKVNVAALNPAKPGEPLDPHGVDYPITSVQQGADGTLYLLSSELQSVFRWSPVIQDYLDTIPLLGNAKFLAYAQSENALVLTYADKKVTKLSLDSLQEEHLFNSPQEPCGLAMAGDFIFLCDPSGAWVSHFTYTLGGELIDQNDWNYYSREYVWNPVNNNMYFFRDDTSPNDLLREQIEEGGLLGAVMDSPYHSSEGIRHPIRVAPNGSYVLLGSGRIYDADNLTQVNTLSNDIVDAVWRDGQMITLWERSTHNEIQFWDNRLAIERTGKFLGDPVRLFEHDGNLITVSRYDNAPWLAAWNADMSQSDLAASLTSSVGTSPEGTGIVYDLTVSNRGVSEATNANVSLLLPPEVHSPLWSCEGIGGASCDIGPHTGELDGQFNIPVGGELHFSLNALLQGGLIDAPPEGRASVDYDKDPQTDNNVTSVLSDTLLSRSKTGTWYAPSRDGEGYLIEITDLGDRLVAVIAWYTYVDGEQAWLFGNADFPQGTESVDIPVIYTEGAGFGSAFDPNDIITTNAGIVTLSFTRENELTVGYQTMFGSGVINAVRLDGALTRTDVASSDQLTEHHSGAWHDSYKPGEGLLISVTQIGSENVLVVSWFTYMNGRQAWLIGSAAFTGAVQQVTLPLISATGASFGEAFSSSDVVYDDWGSATFTLTGCMSATLSYDGKYGSGDLLVTKSVSSIAPSLCDGDPGGGLD
jgi:hypothetical protein